MSQEKIPKKGAKPNNGSLPYSASPALSCKSERLEKEKSSKIIGDDDSSLQRSNSRSSTSPSPATKKRHPKTSLLRVLSGRTTGSTNSVRVNYITEAWAAESPALSSSLSLNAMVLPGIQTPKVIRAGQAVQICEFPNVVDPFGVNSSILAVFDDAEYLDTVGSADSENSILRRTFSLPGVYSDKPTRPHVRDIFGEEGTDWRHTMEDLAEVSENEDSLQSRSSRRLLLARVARTIPAQEQQPVENLDHLYDDLESLSQADRKKFRKKYMKNLIILAVAFMMFFSSYFSIRNLQSSLNDIGGLGMYSLCSVYFTLFIGSVTSKFVVERLRPKRAILCGCLSMLCYVASNFYPSYYTIIPASLFVGFWIANMFTAQATYLSNSASCYSEYCNKTMADVMSYFNGIFYAFFHLGSIVGNGISSLILTHRDHENENLMPTDNVSKALIEHANASLSDAVMFFNNSDEAVEFSHCGATFDPADAVPSAQSVSVETRYLLLCTYLVILIIGTLVLVFGVDPLEGVMMKSKASLGYQIAAVFKFFLELKVALLVPLMAYSLLQAAFMFGEFTKSFVTCTTGVHMVGYIMMCIAACACVASYVAGNLAQVTGRAPLTLAALLVHQILLVVLHLWQPVPSQSYVLFIIAGLWGFADGTLHNQIISLLGSVFADNRVSAFAALKVVQAVAAFLMFLSSPYLLASHKIYVMEVVGITAAACYTGMEVIQHRLSRSDKSMTVEVPLTM